MKDLRQIAVIRLGLLSSSITLRVLRSLPSVKAVCYTYHPCTSEKARHSAVATKIIDEILKIKEVIKNQNKQIENCLESAKNKRSALINYKIKNKELIS